MKVPTRRLRKAAAKRMRVQAGPSGERQAPVPKRQAVRVSPLSERRPPSALEVDLTADTPPEGTAVVRGEEETQFLVEPTLEAVDRGWGEGILGEGPSVEGPSGEGPSGEGPLGEGLSGEGPSGEGPSGEGPSPGESAGSPARPMPGSDATAEGEGVVPPPQGPSFFDDRRRIERLITQAIPPESKEELKHLGARVFYREAFTALVRAAASLAVTRDIINGGEAAICQVQLSAEEAHARAEAAEKALEAARSDRAAAVKEAEDRAASEANRLRAALDQLGMAESAIEARNIQIAELESAVQEADARAALAEEGEREAISLAAEREARAQEDVAAAEARAARAVEDFKASERFMEELTEASAEAFIQGFHCGREKVARVLNLPQALEIEPDRASEVSSSDDESAAADP